MLSPTSRSGFTIVEVIIALVILSVAVLGLSSSAASLATRAAQAELRTRALNSVQDRLSQIQIDPRYARLDSLYAAVEDNALGLTGFTRTTTITRVDQSNPPLTYVIASVVVSGPTLGDPVGRRLVIAAP